MREAAPSGRQGRTAQRGGQDMPVLWRDACADFARQAAARSPCGEDSLGSAPQSGRLDAIRMAHPTLSRFVDRLGDCAGWTNLAGGRSCPVLRGFLLMPPEAVEVELAERGAGADAHRLIALRRRTWGGPWLALPIDRTRDAHWRALLSIAAPWEALVQLGAERFGLDSDLDVLANWPQDVDLAWLRRIAEDCWRGRLDATFDALAAGRVPAAADIDFNRKPVAGAAPPRWFDHADLEPMQLLQGAGAIRNPSAWVKDAAHRLSMRQRVLMSAMTWCRENPNGDVNALQALCGGNPAYRLQWATRRPNAFLHLHWMQVWWSAEARRGSDLEDSLPVPEWLRAVDAGRPDLQVAALWPDFRSSRILQKCPQGGQAMLKVLSLDRRLHEMVRDPEPIKVPGLCGRAMRRRMRINLLTRDAERLARDIARCPEIERELLSPHESLGWLALAAAGCSRRDAYLDSCPDADGGAGADPKGLMNAAMRLAKGRHDAALDMMVAAPPAIKDLLFWMAAASCAPEDRPVRRTLQWTAAARRWLAAAGRLRTPAPPRSEWGQGFAPDADHGGRRQMAMRHLEGLRLPPFQAEGKAGSWRRVLELANAWDRCENGAQAMLLEAQGGQGGIAWPGLEPQRVRDIWKSIDPCASVVELTCHADLRHEGFVMENCTGTLSFLALREEGNSRFFALSYADDEDDRSTFECVEHASGAIGVTKHAGAQYRSPTARAKAAAQQFAGRWDGGPVSEADRQARRASMGVLESIARLSSGSQHIPADLCAAMRRRLQEHFPKAAQLLQAP